MTPTVQLGNEHLAHFREKGWLRLDAITTPEEVERLRVIFDRLFAERAGWKQGKSFDLVGAVDEGKAALLPQILNPVEFAPELADTHFRGKAFAIATRLLGEGTVPWFEHAIFKPAHIGAPTPWHQDEAHRYDPGVEYAQVSIWMPLQPATVENGCMSYISGSHLGPVLEHRSLGGDPKKAALECIDDFDRSSAEPCELPPGGAAIHHCRTLHSAGANTTGEPRRAYVLAFRGATRTAPEQRMFPWLEGKRTAATERAEAWENRGGVFGKAARGVASFARRATRRLRRTIRG